MSVFTWISYSLSSKNMVRAMGDLAHAWYFRRGRWREPPYFAVIYLARPW